MAAQPSGPPSLPGSVTIGLAEYNQMLDRIAAAPPLPQAIPVAVVASRADVVLHANGDVARATITLQGEVLRSGPTGVPLLSGGTVLDVQSNGQTLPLLQQKGAYVAVLPGKGPFTLTIDMGRADRHRAGPRLGDAASDHGRQRARHHRCAGRGIRPPRGLGTRDPPHRGGWPGDYRGHVDASRHNARHLVVARDRRCGAGTADTRAVGRQDAGHGWRERPSRHDPVRSVGRAGHAVIELTVRIPAGFEVSSVSGPTIEVVSEREGAIALAVTGAERNRHQFLVALERSASDASMQREIPLPWIEGSQRETGEVAIEGVGALELKMAERPSLTRVDVGEVAAALQSLAREPLLAAYRYQRRATEPVAVSLEAIRFPDAAVLTAIAEREVATTLVTAEGRALTEVSLTLRNQAQPFLKVGLPQGAVLLSAEVAGVSVKPAVGADGVRVPLLRPGFQARGPYTVSFVYLHAGAAFAKKGDASMSLARVDIPVTWLEWELFLPDRFEVSRFNGDAFAEALLGVTLDTVADSNGPFSFMAKKPAAAPQVGSVAETVTVTGGERNAREGDQTRQIAPAEPSVNVQNLQRRAAGVLPVRFDVPRTGQSHTFVRPVVLDEETTVAFRYKTR